MYKLCIFLPLFLGVASKPNYSLRVKRDAVTDPSQSCNSLVYCQGSLLDTVQRARIFSDSKTFVDMSQINTEEITLRNFNALLAQTNNNPTKAEVAQFVQENFENDTELATWTPEDFNPSPSFLKRIKDDEIKTFASDLVGIWPSLGRKVSSTVFQNPEKHSLIGVPNGIIIPGGRFKEFYYWDSYWIIEGLLISDMPRTARGMIENLLSMVETYGFVPNGGRIYYLNRSQPPLLTLMAALYLKYTDDIEWIRAKIGVLDKELTYWLQEKTVDVVVKERQHRLAHYISESTTPRPESYYEDITTCTYFPDGEQQKHCYQGLKSGAESGWDFSSRWFFDEDGGVKTNLTHIDAQRVIPVDLNAFLCGAFRKLSSFYFLIGDGQNALKWAQHSESWLIAINQVLYDDQDGIWYDFDLDLSRPRKIFFPSNFAPLWPDLYDAEQKKIYGKRAAKYFKKLRIDEFKGGIPTSLDQNNEQWDLPNAWPPLQELVILGLWDSGDRLGKQIAKKSAGRWIEANLKGYQEQNAMFEKYDSSRVGQYGGGGEYEVQKGFGWTNGVALKLIDKFYARNTDDEENSNEIGD
ncbi:hypothetical protein HUJ04_007985 [Dendroctonus ponderosae]